MSRVPANGDAIDAAWLTDALQARHPGARVASVELADRAEVTNAHVWLRVHHAEDSAGGPTALFGKLLPNDPARRVAIAHTRMGLREAKFYESLAPQLSLRVPEAHVVRYEEDAGGAFVLLLEDLGETGCRVSSGPESPTPDQAAQALAGLAAMHVRFEDGAVRARDAGWVGPPDPPSDYGSARLQEGLDHHRDRLTPAFAEMAEVYIAEQGALHALWSVGAQTVIHGDLHIGNLFFDGDGVGFLDWGLVTLGPALRDVSYFLCMSLSVADRRACERDLIRHYLDARRALGGAAIPFDEAWTSHRLQASYLAVASCQIVTFPEDVTPRRAKFAAAFLERASAALEDLESRAALRTYSGI
ncbi:MAG: aminoglycoside phosphotransferase family protein [Myxococcota bacterium]